MSKRMDGGGVNGIQLNKGRGLRWTPVFIRCYVSSTGTQEALELAQPVRVPYKVTKIRNLFFFTF